MKLYTDGSCKKNGNGGWAFVLLEDDESAVIAQSEAVSNTTNNRMELQALIEGLKEASKKESKNFHCSIYTDSAYCLNCYKEGWYQTWKSNGWINSKKEPVKNRDLWEELIPFFSKPQYRFLKVVGHSGDRYNEMVDSMAQTAADSLK